MYAGRVACCPLVNHGEYADGVDRRPEAVTMRQRTVIGSVVSN